jgi:rod shape-determining protein MreC
MRNLLNFLARYNNLIIFLFLEGIAFYMLSSGNSYQNSRLLNSIRGVTRGFEQRIYNTRSYLSLRQANEKLAEENIALKNIMRKPAYGEKIPFSSVDDSLFKQQYVHTSAEVIENSMNRQKNFFTINKGDLQGIKVGMAVVSPSGVAGVVVGCSKNFSVAMSVLNIDFKLSARIRSNGYYGSLGWDGKNYQYAVLNEIPQHVNVNVGDTIEATGFSAIFPEGSIVGTVSDYEKKGGDFYKIKVLLMTDFKKLHFVDVIGNLKKKEQLDLEKIYQ